MSFGSELTSLASKLGEAIWPSPSKSKVFLESLGRGVSWALVLILALAVPVFALSLNSQNFGVSLSVDDLARSIVVLAVAASGSSIQLIFDGQSFQGDLLFLDIGSSLSLITLLVGYLAYRAGSRIKEFRNSSESVKQLAGFSSLGLGLGFAGALYLATLLASGSLAGFAMVELAPMSFTSFLWAFFVVGLPAWLGASRSGNRKTSSTWRWAFSGVRTFGIFYLTLLGVLGLVFLVYNWVTPEFAASVKKAGPSTELELNGWLVFAVVVGILIFLPTILFNAFAVALGAEYAFRFKILGLDILSLLESVPFIDGVSIATSLGSVSVLGTLGVWAFIVLMFSVALASLISGLVATGKVSMDVVFRRDLITGLLVVFLVGFVLKSITQLTGVWTNRGVAPRDAIEGSLLLEEGFITVGLTAASFAFVLAVIALFMVLGASTAAPFIQESFPRLTSVLSSGSLEKNIDRGLFSMIFGRVIASGAALAIVLPLGVAVIERAWASIDNPTNKFREVQALAETGELEELKAFLTQGSEGDTKWLPDEVLEGARPNSSSRNPIEITNNWNEPWKVGQLDAYGELSWDTPSGSVVLNLGTESEVTENLRFIHHARYTATAQRLKLKVSLGEFLTDAGRTEISVNGSTVAVGTYDAIPGTYAVKSPGFQLVAPSETVFVTDGSQMTFTAKEEALVPSAASAILDKEIDRKAQLCGEFSSLDTPKCFSLKDILASREPVGTPPADEYFSIKTGEFKVIKTTCSGSGTDQLLSASSVERTSTCKTEMTFEVTYFESKIQVDDVFTTQIFNACPGFSTPCNRSRQVKIGTRETEVIGDRIGRGTMSSSVLFSVEAKGTLRDNGTFEIIDQFVPPVYVIEQPVVEEPEAAEPVKLLGYYQNLEALRRANPSGQVGDGYVVSPNLNLYVWDGRDWTLIGRR
jgi:hypothetical protein